MDSNKIYEIMQEYNAGKLDFPTTTFLLITEAGCDAEGVEAVMAVYGKKDEEKLP